MSSISKMVDKVFTKVVATEDELLFENEAESFKFYHKQECCESVYIEDICGSLQDLVGHPILLAEESCNSEYDRDNVERVTWTFYKFATIKGYVDVRWCGSSNGCYSERVDLEYKRKG